MFHAGTSLFTGCKMRYADPYTFDDVINDFRTSQSCSATAAGRSGSTSRNSSQRSSRTSISTSPAFRRVSSSNTSRLCASSAAKFLFGSDFPGVPGIRKNYDVLASLIADEEAMHNIGFRNAYDLFGFWKEGLFEVRDETRYSGWSTTAAEKYRGVIPDDRWHEPYMPMEEVRGRNEAYALLRRPEGYGGYSA